MKRLTALLLWLPLVAAAAPWVPRSDADVVQRLPYRPDAAERARRDALARDPAQLPLAAAAARQALERARVHGDPRELGVAEAVLAPWWARVDAPAEAVLLRARVLQARHDFDLAAAQLRSLLAREDLAPAERAQALLDAAALHQLRAELPEARALCAQLQPLAPQPAAACLAELDSLGGQARAAAQVLAQLGGARARDPGLALVRAELAERLGDDAQAPALYRLSLAGEDTVYTRAALADWLLARKRAAEALALLARSPDAEADALLLRRVIALEQLGRRDTGLVATLRERLAAGERREPGRHAREQARFALDVDGQPREALRLAQKNWQLQREPVDAVLLMRAAQAAGAEGQPVLASLARELRAKGWQDARLAALDRSFLP
ncbi:MAG: hypothetical protein EKK53_02655 [Burkholderiales bacterium]|nr:MAG: hypothetical protein EKK53_02655 [Burkholderiales bacterium]